VKYLILGASAAGLSAAETIRRQDHRGELTVVSGDHYIYSRCLLPDVLAGRRDAGAARFVPKDFMELRGIRWIGGVKAEKLWPGEKAVVTDTGEKFYYDKLLIATGASSFLPPVENIDRGRQVYGLRSLEDVQAITEASGNCPGALVMGGGLVGVDTAAALNEKGLAVAIVEAAGQMLPLQLDRRAASRYEELLKAHGIKIITGAMVSSILLDEGQNVTGARLNDGRVVPCGLVVCAAGVRPNLSFLEGTAVEIGRGVRVNQYQETSLTDIYAAGDVCESLETFTGQFSPTPIWPLAVRQGQVAGTNMAGGHRKMTNNFAYKNSMSFYGLNTISYGLPEAPDDSYQTYIEEGMGSYKKVIVKNGCLKGAIFQGDITRAGVIGALIRENFPAKTPGGSLFDLSYAHFFSQREDGQFVYDKTFSTEF